MANEEIVLRINPIMETGDVKKAVDQIEGFFKQMNLSGSMKSDVAKIFKDMRGEAESFERASKEAFKTPGEIKSFESSAKKIDTLFSKIINTMDRLGGENLEEIFRVDDSKIQGLTQELTKLQQQLNSLTAASLDKISDSIKSMSGVSKSSSLKGLFEDFQSGDLDTAGVKIENLIKNIQAFGGATAETKSKIENMLTAFQSGDISKFDAAFKELVSGLGKGSNIEVFANGVNELVQQFNLLAGDGSAQKIRQNISEMNNEISQIKEQRLRELADALDQARSSAAGAQEGVDRLGRSLVDAGQRSMTLGRQMDELKSRATYFLGLENSVDLFRQAIREAIDVVKELDKAMTETAVVTDFSVGDMWESLPQYTQMANELGVATQGVYEASTLYYQQGLKTEEVMALTNETLKMARIAGLECADATNLMTAALRGFNMEINQASAQRVNDVYSELAAITAADTNEIATAMTKTASIAASANMELETTAALLAQMIETTREPAETAGTAMKTIVARFTEMKKAVGDVVTVEGEEVSVNKVDAALASVGVSLKNANGEFRNLDDVLLELASKWNSLDIMSQRYIATTAAGSRQQSRFIAMMQDYGRTMELVEAAYNSSGSSSQQFEKTLESLESKLSKLENAWNEYLMGIANSTIIKGAIDLLTGLLNIINKITTVPGDTIFSGMATSVVKLTTAVLAFQLALKGIDKAFTAFEAHRSAIREMQSIRMTGAFTSGKEADEIQKNAAKTGNRRYFIQSGKEKAPTKKINKAAEIAEKKNQQKIQQAKNAGASRGLMIRQDQEKLAASKKEREDLKGKRGKDNRVRKKELNREIADLQVRVDENSVEATRARVAKLEKELEAAPVEKRAEIEYNLAEAKAELEVLESTESTETIKKRVEVDTAKANMEIEAMEAQQSDPIVKQVITSGKQGFLDGKGDQNWFKGGDSLFSTNKADMKQKTKDFFDSFGNKSKDAAGKMGGAFAKAGNAASKGLGSLVGVLAGIPGPVYAVVAGIAAITAAVVLLWHASEEQVLKRSLEEATLQTDNLAAAQEELSQRLTKVNEGFDALSGHKATLDSLVQGTLAWNEALLANNETVLELIKNNPELSEYMTVGDNGELSISKEGQNAYVEKLLKQQAGTQAGLLNNQAYKSYLEGESKILKDFEDRDTYTVASDSERGVSVTQSFKNAYAQGKTDVAGTKEERVAYQEYYNAKKKNESQFVKSLAGNAKGFLKEDATEMQQNTVSKIAEGLMTNSDINNLDGKYVQGLKISKGADAAKLDARGATKETIEGLTDYQLASAGFEWTDDTKTSLKKIGSDSETTFQVTKHGHTDTEANVNHWLEKNKKNVNIDAGYIMSQVAKAEIPNNYNAIAAKITEGLSDDALRTISGEALDDVAGAESAIKSQYNVLKNQLNETTDEEGKKILEDAISYYENEFQGINTDDFSLADRNESNKKDIIDSLSPYGIDLEGASAEKLNDYKSMIDKFSTFGSDGVGAISAFNDAYNKLTESADKEKFTDFATSLNTNSAIEGFKQLKEGAESSNKAIKEFSESMLKSAETGGFYSGLSQLKEIVSSEEFTDPENGLAKELAELADKGELAASDILELAESGTLLDSALEAGALSAGALAEIFQQMTEEGKDLTDFTQTYINYLNELTASATASAEALQFVKDFTAPEAQTSAQDGWMEWATELRGRAKAGAYNDQAFTALLKNFASDDQWEKWEKEGTSNSDRYKALESVIKNSEKGSYSVLKAGATSKEQGNATYLSNGQLKFNLSEYSSTKDLITGIAKQYKISEDYAKQLISDARIYNTELDNGLKTLDKQNAFKQDYRTYGSKNEKGEFTMNVSDKFAKERGYENAQAYIAAFQAQFSDPVKMEVTPEMKPNTIDKFKEYVKNKVNSNPDEGVSVYSIVGAGQAAGLSDEQIMEQTKAAVGDTTFSQIQAQLQEALTAAQDVADAEQQANIAGQKAAVYDAYYEGVSQGVLDALNGLEVPITISFTNADGTVQEVSGKLTMKEGKAGTKDNTYNADADAADANAKAQKEAYDELMKKLEAEGTPTTKPTTDPTVNPYSPYDPNGGGKGADDGYDLGEKESDKIKAKIDEIDSAIENLADNDIVDMREINKLSKKKIALQKEYQEQLEKELGLYEEAKNKIWKDVADKGYDKYIEYNEEAGMYEYTDKYYEEFYEDGMPIESEELSKIQQTCNTLNDIASDQLSAQVAIKELVANLVQNEVENYNAERGLTGVERRQTVNDRERELIGKLPQEVQGPLLMASSLESMMIEYDEIQETKKLIENKQQGLDAAWATTPDELKPYLTFDEFNGYQVNEAAISQLSTKEEQDSVSTQALDAAKALNTRYDEIYELEETIDGGKIQKAFESTGKTVEAFSKALKDTKGQTDDLGDAFADLGKGTILEKPLRELGHKFEDLIDRSGILDEEFKGFGKTLDKIPISDGLKNLVSKTLGEDAAGQLGDKGLGTALTGLFSEGGAMAGMPGAEAISGLLGESTVGAALGSVLGPVGTAIGSMGSLLSFDMMGTGMDMFGQMKDMASQMIQYVVQFITTVINWWINREDWLYNLLSAIEQEVHNFNRQEQVEERFRLYSDEGLDDLVSAWEAMRESLEKQIDLNEQLIESRQAELQFLNLTNLPFSPAFYYDYTEERVIENPWVYDIYVLLLDLGAMLPEIGQIFSSIKQLMEDNKKRMEDAVKEIEDAREEILELEKKQLELRTKYMEDEIELEELVMDTIIEKQQEEIDELSAMNDAISEGNEKLIETLNNKLDLIRQQRDNEDKEEELGEKERRLAYLRQDTSNANRAEIYDLQKELKDERRDYTDELIDQKISALEEQNEKAAEQRQKQIDLLQAQLDHTEKYGLQWEEAQTLIKNGFDSEGRLRVGTDLFDMLMSKEDFTSMGNGSTRQVQQIMDWNVMSIAAAAFREINDIWDEGFGNFAMSNDVHDQSRLHLWADREVDYYQLPSYLGFLQPAVNTIQDYLWRTGNNIETFIDTGFLSGKNSSSILGKTVVPILEGIFGELKKANEDYNALSLAETGTSKTHTGIIETVSNSLGYSFGEGILKDFTEGVRKLGATSTDSVSNNNENKKSVQFFGGITLQNYFNSEDGQDISRFGENLVDAFREGISNLSIFK